jgi:parallel beta-helix repeat protein
MCFCCGQGTNRESGIWIHGTDNAIVEDNTMHESNTGLYVTESNNVISRNNVIYNNTRNGIVLQVSFEATIDSEDNVVVHNTVYGNGYDQTDPNIFVPQVSINPCSDRCYLANHNVVRTRFKNNILAEDQSREGDLFVSGTTNILDYNNYYQSSRDDLIIWWDPVVKDVISGNPHQYNWGDYLSASGQDANSITTDPCFIDSDFNNPSGFRLKSTSLCVDAGGFLTVTTNGCYNCNTVEVSDARYFCDGYGIVDGDWMQINSDVVQVMDVNYVDNIITIDRNISWSQGDSVSYPYAGTAPDMGAFEYGGAHNITSNSWYHTIQSAIDEADNGNEIVVWPGRYYETITIDGWSGTLRSKDPNDPGIVATTIIDANNVSVGVMFENGEELNSILNGFTIIGSSSYGIRCNNASPAINHCIIDGGGNGTGVSCDGGSATIHNCTIRNHEYYGILAEDALSLEVKNCIIYGMGDSGILLNDSNSVIVANNTIVSNTEYGIDSSNSTSTITNCILWNNGDDLNGCSATYSCIEDNDSGTGNIHSDPCFVDPNDYHLASDSPCINAGDPDGNYDGQTDIDNQDRVMGALVDIGADENEYDGTVCNVTRRVWYKTINDAIDDASTGNEIVAYPNTYNETIYFDGKAITVRSNDPDDPNVVAATVIVRNGGTQGAVNFTSGETSSSVLSGFTITGTGYGVYCSVSSPMISNCIVKDNTTYGIYCYWCSASISGCIVENNTNYGIYCSYGSTLISDCKIKNNSSSGVSCVNSSSVVQNCTIENNSSYGIFLSGASGSPTIANCVIRNNGSRGVYRVPMGSASFVIKDCVISGNGGPGIQSTNTSGTRTIKNNTIVGNTSVGIWGHSSLTIINNILWGNGDDLYNCSATYSCIEDNDSGTGNIHTDPNFVDADYHIASDSPCIDVGNNSAVTSGDKDIDGDDRIIDGGGDPNAIVDMGADEYKP